jgi:uncharacterized RmlC-like cupin family protein
MWPASFGRGTAATCTHPRRNGSTGGAQEEIAMKQPMTSLPTRLEAGGVCIQAQDWSGLNVARIRFPRGANATPLLEGLPNDLCQCPHWGTVLSGSIHVRYADGSEEIVRAGDVYYWPPGHTVWVDEDYEAVEFSPSEPMCQVIDHLKSKLST